MSQGSTIRRLCTVCARGGSQGVPGKNTRLIAGKPLIAHTIERAVQSRLFALIAVDSDSESIRRAALEAGADIAHERPAEMASSHAAKVPVIARAARESEASSGMTFDTFVDLDATSPLRDVDDIVGAVELLETTDASNIISVAPAHRSPYFNLVEENHLGYIELSKESDIVRRQDSPPCYDINGSIYAWKREPFLSSPFLLGRKTRAFVMPRERSFDIDEPIDFDIVEMLLERRRQTAAVR